MNKFKLFCDIVNEKLTNYEIITTSTYSNNNLKFNIKVISPIIKSEIVQSGPSIHDALIKLKEYCVVMSKDDCIIVKEMKEYIRVVDVLSELLTKFNQ